MKIESKDFTMGEEVVCPQCKDKNTYQYDTDEKEFSYDGTGHINTDHACRDCGKRFRTYTNFTYIITAQSTSD